MPTVTGDANVCTLLDRWLQLSYLRVVPPHVVHNLQDVQFALVAVCQALQDFMEPGQVENEAS